MKKNEIEEEDFLVECTACGWIVLSHDPCNCVGVTE
jgi:hypothetical protein